MKPSWFCFLLLVAAVSLTGCVEEFEKQPGVLSGLTEGAAAKPAQPQEVLTKHDVALRFLTAYIRLDRNLALRYATPEAVAALDWNRPHGQNIPYYDDKMILHYTGGWARVYFQQFGESYQISRIEAHRR